jgi:hypothetical protein
VVQPLNDTTLVATTHNLDRQQYYALSLTAPVDVATWWKVYNNAELYYRQFVGTLPGTTLNRGGPAFNLSSNQALTFGKGWSAEVNGSYSSRLVYGFVVQRSTGSLDVGVKKSLWARRGNLKFSVSDVLYTQRGAGTSTFNNRYVERFVQRRDSRVATLSFSYKFGNDKLTTTSRKSGAEDEKKRAQ